MTTDSRSLTLTPAPEQLNDSYFNGGRIIGWRIFSGGYTEVQYVFQYRHAGNATCAIVLKEDLPKHFFFDYHYAGYNNLNSMKRKGPSTSSDLVSILALAWTSPSEPFTLIPVWEEFEKLDGLTDQEGKDVARRRLDEMLDEILLYMEWMDGQKTWESGSKLKELMGQKSLGLFRKLVHLAQEFMDSLNISSKSFC
ncbi:hypothetical protein K469DRAFT_686702 [Zopfia rhizophila CBS 207.26]|uniref:Uncharacterized protein n=1 Tax=Zopfia rhizophila CBS 207.26 TaxID=1314779 RepID=A0A6A6ET24_9PEZI|nr:hypothetical protein K469DRAFT_686702 [Zopfia rhizophila CBS 207.26]